MHSSKKHKIWIISLLLISSLTLFIAGCGQQNNNTSKKDPDQEKKDRVPLTEKQIKKNINAKKISVRQDEQKELTQEYQEVAQNQNYTLENPFVKVNPYKTSPLSALVVFHTSIPASVKYTVIGKNNETTLTNKVNGGASTVHKVPIVGLYADHANRVRLDVQYQNGTTETKELTLNTDKLPANLQRAKSSVSNKKADQMDIGDNKLTVMNRTTQEPFAVDSNGEIRWYSTLYTQHVVESWSQGHLMILTKKDNSKELYNSLLETDALGRVYQEYQFTPKNKRTLIHHDIVELPNHNILATVSDGSVYGEDTIAEISHQTGKIVNLIDMKRLLPKSVWYKYKADKGAASDGSASPGHDWLHMNSIEYLPEENSLLVSNRNQDLIFKLDYRTKEFKWLYSGKKKSAWPKKYHKYLLTPEKGTKHTGGQHALTQLPNDTGDPNKENILLYDNNIAVTNGPKKTSGKYSQGTQYQIDQKNKTIKQTWSYGKQLGKQNFTPVIGNAQRLDNGNTLLTFGFKNGGKESNIIEVKPDGTQVFNFSFKHGGKKGYVYRAYRMPLYDDNYRFE